MQLPQVKNARRKQGLSSCMRTYALTTLVSADVCAHDTCAHNNCYTLFIITINNNCLLIIIIIIIIIIYHPTPSSNASLIEKEFVLG
jgi:hypothetical protein